MFINAFLKKKDVKMRGKKEEKPSMKRNGIETSCVIIIVFIRPNFFANRGDSKEPKIVSSCAIENMIPIVEGERWNIVLK